MDDFGRPMHFHLPFNPPSHFPHPPGFQNYLPAPPLQPQLQYVPPGPSLRTNSGPFPAAPGVALALRGNYLQPVQPLSPEHPLLGHLPRPPLQPPQARQMGQGVSQSKHAEYVHSSSRDPIIIDSDSDSDIPFLGRKTLRNRPNHPINRPETVVLDDAIQPQGQPRTSRVVESQSQQTLDSVSGTDPEDQYRQRLEAVLEVFPDISRDYVRRMWDQSYGRSAQPSTVTTDQFVLQIIDAGSYPKESDKIKERKRKREMYADSDEEEAAEFKGSDGLPDKYLQTAQRLLQNEFPYVPVPYIMTLLNEHRRLFQTFFILEDAERTYPNPQTAYRRLKKPRRPIIRVDHTTASFDPHMPDARGYGLESLQRELAAAKRQSKKKEDTRIAKEADKKADEVEDQKQIAAKLVDSCGVCYDDEIPLRKIAECRNGHTICIDCLRNHGNNAIGENKGHLVCATEEDCNISYRRTFLERALGEKALGRLEFLDQQADLKAAGIDDLAECPFCDFKAIIAQTKEVNKEFRCFNPDCEKVSCRLCDKISHVPLSCDEAKAGEGINERHLVEEAMSAAVMRICPGCKTPVMKEYGCNMMVCSERTCQTAMCDHCNTKLRSSHDYSHFDRGLNNGNRCPLYDNLEHRNAAAAAAAEKTMLEKLKTDNPNLSEDQLKVTAKMTSHVNQPRFDFSGAPAMGQIGRAGANRWGAFDMLREIEEVPVGNAQALMDLPLPTIRWPPMVHNENNFGGHGPLEYGPIDGPNRLPIPEVTQHLQEQQRRPHQAQGEVGNALERRIAEQGERIRREMADMTRQVQERYGQPGGRAYDRINARVLPPPPLPQRPSRGPAYALDRYDEVDAWEEEFDDGGIYDEDVQPFHPHARIGESTASRGIARRY